MKYSLSGQHCGIDRAFLLLADPTQSQTLITSFDNHIRGMTMSDYNKRIIGKYNFSSSGPLPSDEVLMQMLEKAASGKSERILGIPESVFEDETEQGQAFQQMWSDLGQEVSILHPYVTCIFDGLPPGCDRHEATEDDEEEMCSFWLTTPEYDAAFEPKAIEVAKSFGLI